MNELKKGQAYKVIASDGLNLRTGPTIHSQIIDLMQEGSLVILLDDHIQEHDGYHWYNVEYEDETGWAAGEYLEYVPPVVPETPTPGMNPDMYSFVYENLRREITINNLKNAIDAHKITINKVTDTQSQIMLDKPYNNITAYWASRSDLHSLVINPPVN